MWTKGNKIKIDDITFDSQKEANFYIRFVKDSGYKYEIHKPYILLNKFVVKDNVNIRGLKYTPDFVIYDKQGKILHVYDVKNSFTVYGIDQAAQLRFKLFMYTYHLPLECVVVRTHDFKTTILGTTKKRKITIHKSFDYSWKDNLILPKDK